MKSLLRKFTTGAIIAGMLSSITLAASPAGYIDFGSFRPDAGEQYVEVDINKALLTLASAFAKHEDPEVAEIMAKLDRVRVNVLGIDDNNRTETTARIETIRAELDRQGWNRVVTVRENSGENIAVFLMQSDDESIQGVVITVMGGDGEAVLVNVVGDVRLDQIAKLGARLDIDPLRDLNLTPAPAES